MAAKGLLTILQSDHPASENSFAQPENVSPKETSISIKGNKINLYFFALFVFCYQGKNVNEKDSRCNKSKKLPESNKERSKE